MARRHMISWTLLGIGLGALSAAGCGDAVQAAEPPHAEAIPVKLAPVTRGLLARPVRASGTLHRKSEADLAFKVGGVVTRVAVDTGAHVRKGQLLATVDATEAQAALSQLSQAAIKAERDLTRVKGLHDTGAVGPVDVQNAETAVQVARAAADAASFNLRHTSLVAPDDGVIDRRIGEVGEIAAPGRPMFHLRSASRGLVVRAQLVDRDALGLHVGDPARVILDAMPEHIWNAAVAQIASSVSIGTGTIEVELRIEDRAVGELPSGLSAKVEIARSELPLPSIPVAALVDGDGMGAAVYVVEGDRAKRVPVRVSFLSDDRAALASGLEHIESVVELGATRLEDGSAVRITTEGARDAR